MGGGLCCYWGHFCMLVKREGLFMVDDFWRKNDFDRKKVLEYCKMSNY